jgi:hypothetical protein
VPVFVFATSVQGTNSNLASGIAIDSAGNCFVTGYFDGTATFGTTSLTSAGVEDMFVAKYDPTGKLLWVRQAGGRGTNEWCAGFGVAVDAAANCYVTGAFNGTAYFGFTDLTATGTNGYEDVFVAKYDGSGNLLWVRQGGGIWGDDPSGIAVDTNGNSYVTGSFIGPATFGTVTLTATGPFPDSSGFVAKYDTDGNVLWARPLGGGTTTGGSGVTVDGQGNAWVTGSVFSPVTYSQDLSVYKLDSSGSGVLGWEGGRLTANQQALSFGSAITADGAGNVFVTGGFKGLVTVGTNALGSASYSALLAKCDTLGNILWVTSVGGTNYGGTGVAADPSGNCFLAAEFSGYADFWQTNLESVGANDAFIAKYGPSGNLLWVAQAGGGQDARPLGIAWVPGKGIYIAGGFIGQVKFGDTVLATSNPTNWAWNAFLSRVDEMPILTASNTASAVVLSWPTNQLGFTLEKATNSLPPSQWSTVTNRVSVSGDHYVVTDQFSGSSSFYRLRKP